MECQPSTVCVKWSLTVAFVTTVLCIYFSSRLQLKRDGAWWRTGGEVKGKLANALGSQYPSHYTSKHGLSSITTADAYTSAASSGLNWRHCRFKWTRPFRRKTKSGFCACAITFQMQSICESLQIVFLPWKTAMGTYRHGAFWWLIQRPNRLWFFNL